MIRKLAVILLMGLLPVVVRAASLRLADATGGAPLEFIMQAALELSMSDESLSISMDRILPQEALKKLDAGLVDGVIVETRFATGRPQIPLGAEALVLYVSVANPGAELSKDQVLELLSSYRPGWQSYNNLDLDIQRIAMTSLTPSGTLLRRIFGDKIFDEEIFKVDSLNSGFVFINSASIFFAQYFPLAPVDLKMLPVDGVLPVSGSIIDGKYPLSMRYVLVYKGKMSTQMRQLLDLIGQKKYRDVMSRNGWLVLLPHNVEK